MKRNNALSHPNHLALACLGALALAAFSSADDAFDLENFTVKGEFSSADVTRELSPYSRIGGSVLEIPRSVAAIDRHRIEVLDREGLLELT